jgi:hypothetical protein
MRALDVVDRYQRQHVFPPTMDEVAAGLGVRHASTARYHLRRGRDRGLLTMNARVVRSVVLTPTGRKALKEWRETQ